MNDLPFVGSGRHGRSQEDDVDYSYGENALRNRWLGVNDVYGGGPYGNGQMHASPPSAHKTPRVDPDSIPGPPRPGGRHDFGYPEEGPGLKHWPNLPFGLPYEGQESTGGSCSRSGDAPRGCQDLKPKGKPETSAKLGVEGSLVDEKGRSDVLQGDGTTRTTLSLSSSLRATGKAEAESKRKFGFGLHGSVGHTTAYSVSVNDPDRADAIAHGDVDTPNPVDPRSLEVGESATLSKETYTGAGADAAYKELQASVNRDSGDRVSSGITRVGKHRVRIEVGDEDTVRDSVQYGVSDPTGLLSVSGEGNDENASGRERSATLDVGTKRGWRAYQRFVVTGKLPSPDSKAVQRMANTDDDSWQDGMSSEVNIGPLHLGHSETTRQGSESVTRYRNGRLERTWADKTRGVGGAVTTSVKANGKAGNSSYAVRLEDVPSDDANDFLEARGQKADRHGDQDMIIKYTKADLWQLRGEARRLIQAQSHDGTSMMDVDKDLADGERDDVGQHIGLDTAQEKLAMTRSPEQALKVVSATGQIGTTSYMGDAGEYLGWVKFHEGQMGGDSHIGRASLVVDSDGH